MDHARLTDEEQYYLSAVRPDISSWSRAPGEGADPVQMKQFVRSERPPLVLNVGCGRDLIPGFINLDSSAQVGADLVFDLDSCRSQKIPLSDDSVDGIYACHVVEHVRDTLALMQELHRVAKPGAQMVIRVPHGSSNDAFEDPTHVHQFFENSFSYFGQPAYRRADYGYRGDWEVSKVALVMNNASLRALPMPAVLRLVQKTRNQVSEMVVYMKAIKPIRGRVDGESRPPLIDVVFSAFASPADFSQSTAA
jgi:SAM-dependent methyltransferase